MISSLLFRPLVIRKADVRSASVCREDSDFQKGRLAELYGAAKTLGEELKVRL
jgi:hypothetical protein